MNQLQKSLKELGESSAGDLHKYSLQALKMSKDKERDLIVEDIKRLNYRLDAVNNDIDVICDELMKIPKLRY